MEHSPALGDQVQDGNGINEGLAELYGAMRGIDDAELCGTCPGKVWDSF